MNSIGRRPGVNPVEPDARGFDRPADPGVDLLQWAVGIGGTALLLVLGSAVVLRIRRSMLEEVGTDEDSPEALMDSIREAYFEGEIDTDEYQQVRRKLNPAAAGEPPPAPPPIGTG